MRKWYSILLMLVFLVGCSTSQKMNTSLNKVETAGEVRQKQINGSTYEDEKIRIDWKVGETKFDFNLTNKTKKPIKVLWDDSAYLDISRKPHQVFHKGIIYSERKKSQRPSIVQSHGNLQDAVIPTDHAYLQSC